MPSPFITLACLLLASLGLAPSASLVAAVPIATQAATQAVPQAAEAPRMGAASPAGSAEATAVTAMALKIYAQMRAGKVDAALLTPEMNAAATPEILAQTRPMFDTLGDPKELRLESIEKLAKGTNYFYIAIFPTAQFHISLFITPEGKVGGYLLKA